MTAQEILRVLVGIPTPYALSNLLYLDWVKRFLEGKGWRVELFPYTDEREISKANLIARPPGAEAGYEKIGLAFVCHSDTVPIANGWTNALELTASGGGTYLHGCGACDVKGALACFLAAVDSMEQVDPGVALILTADEEIGCKGVKRLLETVKLKIGAAIVSEPTSLRPGISGKGYGLARVTVKGIEAHSAYPMEGLSAIGQAAKLIERIENLATQFSGNAARNADPLFDPPRTTVNIGVIQGGSAKNIVSGECWFLVEWRPIPADPPRAFLTELEWVVDSVRMEEPRVRIHVEPFRAESGFSPVDRGPLQTRIRNLGEENGNLRQPTGISFGSEATRLAPFADEVIVIGPGDMHTAHSSRECVPAFELEEWTATLTSLLAQPAGK